LRPQAHNKAWEKEKENGKYDKKLAKGRKYTGRLKGYSTFMIIKVKQLGFTVFECIQPIF